VKPGWVIAKIGGKEVEPVIRRMSDSLADEHMLGAMLAAAVDARLRGTVGEPINIAFLDRRDRPVDKTLTFADPPGTAATFGNLPTFYVTFDSKRLESNIGYIAFSAFFDPPTVMRKFQQAIEAFRDADGIILDLRGNPGGLGVMGMGMGGFFVTEPDQQLGTMRTRSGEIHFVLNPRVESYTGPLAVLVDESSMSTAEILAGGLQDLKRARVFGTRTPGAALPSVVERLPNGDGFQYAFANYTSVGGQPLEGRGVQPDEVVELDRKSLLQGRDPVIEAAVRWIRSKAAQKRS
jgi:carboxyl-terminal processing protease